MSEKRFFSDNIAIEDFIDDSHLRRATKIRLDLMTALPDDFSGDISSLRDRGCLFLLAVRGLELRIQVSGPMSS